MSIWIKDPQRLRPIGKEGSLPLLINQISISVENIILYEFKFLNALDQYKIQESVQQ